MLREFYGLETPLLCPKPPSETALGAKSEGATWTLGCLPPGGVAGGPGVAAPPPLTDEEVGAVSPSPS